MSEWREWRLGALVDAAGGHIKTGPFGSQLHAHEYTTEPGGVPVVMPKDMVGGRVERRSVSRVDSATAERLKAHYLASGDVVLARRGDVGRFAFVEDDEAGWLCGTGSMRVHAPDHTVVLPRFLRYALDEPRVAEWLIGQSVGSTMPNLNAKIVSGLPLLLPDPPTQRRIAAILSAFDTLIEINERRIEVLEDLARSLYREWFVRFRFPGHEVVEFVNSELGAIPESWDVRRLDEIAILSYGKSLSAGRRRPGPFAVVSSAGVVGEHDEALVIGPGIVLGRKGNVGSVWWIEDAFFPIDTTYYVTSDLPLGWLYWQLSTLQFVDSHAAVPGLSRDQANALLIVRPDADLARRFDDIHRRLFTTIAVLKAQANAFAATRDLLLPRLVSGRLDISDISLGDLLPSKVA